MKRFLLLILAMAAAVSVRAQVSPQTQGAGAPSNPCTSGVQYLDTTNHILYNCNGGVWANVGLGNVANQSTATIFSPTDQTTIQLHDDFYGGSLASLTVGQLNWTMSGSAACGTAVETAGAWPNVGLFTVTTGASSGNTCGITGASASTLGALGSNAGWSMTWVFKVPSNATAGAYVGFSDSLTAVPTNWAGFKYDTSVDAVFHLCVSATCDATTYAADTNFHRLKMRSPVAGQIFIQFDSNAEVSFCAAGCGNTVTPTGNVVTPIAQAVTRTTAAKTLTIDYFGFLATGLAR